MRCRLHDYTESAAYFVTFNTYKKHNTLSRMVNGKIELLKPGLITKQCWDGLHTYYERINQDAFIVMPNHIHLIVILTSPDVGIDENPTSLSEIMRGFKSMSARRINQSLDRQGVPVWNEGFHDRVIRNENELDRFRYYIETNPLRKHKAI